MLQFAFSNGVVRLPVYRVDDEVIQHSHGSKRMHNIFIYDEMMMNSLALSSHNKCTCRQQQGMERERVSISNAVVVKQAENSTGCCTQNAAVVFINAAPWFIKYSQN